MSLYNGRPVHVEFERTYDVCGGGEAGEEVLRHSAWAAADETGDEEGGGDGEEVDVGEGEEEGGERRRSIGIPIWIRMPEVVKREGDCKRFW